MRNKKPFLGWGTFLFFLSFSLAVGATVPKTKTQTDISPQSTETRIDETEIEWRSFEQLKSILVEEIPTKPFKSTGVFESTPSNPIPTSSPLYDTAGYTYFDQQSIDRLSRQIVLSILGPVHVDWMKGFDADLDPREIYYSSWFTAQTPRSASEVQVGD